MAVSAKVASRISTRLRKYQHILETAKQRDISEADTVTIITDILSDALGYDKYKDVSSEHATRGTSKKRARTRRRRVALEAGDNNGGGISKQ
jgi:hypothetical protein